MDGVTIKVRPLVARFAEAMERRLQQADQSGDANWLASKPEVLRSRCIINAEKATHPAIPGDVVAERSAVDAANYAMFLWDKLQEMPSENRGN